MLTKNALKLAVVAALIVGLVPAAGLVAPAQGEPRRAARAGLVAPPSTFVGVLRGRIAVFRSSTGAFVRNLTGKPLDIGLPSVTPNRSRVYFIQVVANQSCRGTYSVPLAGGITRKVRSGEEGGAQPIAAGPHGALAGTYACIASMFVHAKAANGRSYNINGLRDLGADGMSWAPDGFHLAVATLSGGVRFLDVRTTNDLRIAKVAPCPAAVRPCQTHAPAYTPDGGLDYIVVNRARTAAYVVRLSHGVARIVFRLPHVSAHFSMGAAAGGNLLVSGDPDSATMTRSDFVVRWNGRARSSLNRSMVQVDW